MSLSSGSCCCASAVCCAAVQHPGWREDLRRAAGGSCYVQLAKAHQTSRAVRTRAATSSRFPRLISLLRAAPLCLLRYFTPEQAVEYGIIDKVMQPSDAVAVSCWVSTHGVGAAAVSVLSVLRLAGGAALVPGLAAGCSAAAPPALASAAAGLLPPILMRLPQC